jgi:ABC-type uncharacterized transport system YnjBCD substrate-binding protein
MAITVVFEITEGMLWESSAGREERNWISNLNPKCTSIETLKNYSVIYCPFVAHVPMVRCRLYNRVF